MRISDHREMTMAELASKRCIPCEGKTKALSKDEALDLLKKLDPRWNLLYEGKKIEATFEFKNYFRTTAFINAVAWIAHQEDHHPDIKFGYSSATVSYWTHAINGLSENDFICAAKVDALLK
jgi:4a-hydroxytetrahydrobiopterin dehydratase